MCICSILCIFANFEFGLFSCMEVKIMNFNDIFKDFNNFNFINFNVISYSITYLLIFLLLLVILSSILIYIIVLLEIILLEKKNKILLKKIKK